MIREIYNEYEWNNLIPEFKESLFAPAINIISDTIEVGIDSVLSDSLKDIPICGTIINAGKFVQNIHERNLLKQTIVFIKSFNDHTIEKNKLDKYRDSLKNDPKKEEKELGRLLIYLNRFIDDEKSKFIANVFKYYIYEFYDWDKFCELTETVDRLFVSDISELIKIYVKRGFSKKEITYKHERLISVGLLEDKRFPSAISTEELEKF